MEYRWADVSSERIGTVKRSFRGHIDEVFSWEMLAAGTGYPCVQIEEVIDHDSRAQ